MKPIEALEQRRLIIVTGKGGVGKSTVTATLGRLLAKRGRRTLILEVDPRENQHQLLGVAPSGGDYVKVNENLFLQNLKPKDVVDWVVRKQVKIEMLVDRVLGSPVYHRFVEGAPGLKELAILGHALRSVRGDNPQAPSIDTVILDAPATGHGVYLLTAPQLFKDAIGSGPFAELAAEVADFVADPVQCGIVVVTLAEEMPVQESLELRQSLLTLGHQPQLLVVNSLYPPIPVGAVVEAAEAAESAARSATRSAADEQSAGIALWHRRRKLNETQLSRLQQDWSEAFVEMELLAQDRGALLIDSLLPRFEKALTNDANDTDVGATS